LEPRRGPGLALQVALDAADVALRPAVVPRVGREPRADRGPGLTRAVAARTPAAAAVVVVADGRRLVVDVERGRLPAQRLGAGADAPVGDPLDLRDPHRLIDAAAAAQARRQPVFEEPCAPDA